MYFGPTRYTGKQRKARASALQQRHSLSTLTLIETYVSKVKKALDAWNLRIKLAGTPAHRIQAVATARLQELRAKRTAKPGVRITYREQGPNTLSITDDATTIANMRAVLESTNKLVCLRPPTTSSSPNQAAPSPRCAPKSSSH